MKDKTRLYYLDNIKIFLIIIVIIHHVGQAYGSTGGSWYYSYPGERVREMGLFFLFNASYFMGLFFFISGYFLPGSFERHGTRIFIKDKLIRFGIPLAFGLFIMIAVEEYVKYYHYTNKIGFGDYYIRYWLGIDPHAHIPHGPVLNYGHLWFIEHLLIYSLLFALIMWIRGRITDKKDSPPMRRIRLYAIIPFILILGVVTNLMRTQWGFPMDRWIGFLGFIQMEPAHIPQYLSFFILGILAWRWKLLDSISSRRNALWLAAAVIFYAVNLALLFTRGGNAMFFMWEYREAFFCVAISIGLIAFFRLVADRSNRLLSLLSATAFGAYIVHVPIVVALQYAFDPVEWGPGALFTVVSLLSVSLSFLIAWGLKLIPGMKRVL